MLAPQGSAIDWKRTVAVFLAAKVNLSWVFGKSAFSAPRTACGGSESGLRVLPRLRTAFAFHLRHNLGRILLYS